MPKRPVEPDTEVLPDQVATRLLTRASELDAALRAGAQVAELRRAATEAGISTAAFDAALSELQDERTKVPEVTKARRRAPMWIVWVLIVALTFGAFSVARMATPPLRAAPTVEEVFLLRCLTPGEAAELVRPLLRLPTNSVVISESAPRVLTIRATPEQMRDVRSLLDRHEGAPGSTCPTTPAPPVR